ncbi:hypothetical protein ACP70R_039378 [Stipagrostis hirtigluma subsp. patula]
MEESGMEVCGGGRQSLAAELAQVLAMAREVEANMDQGRPEAARELCGALASAVDRSLRIARSSWPPPDSPRSSAGSPAAAAGGGGNAGRDAQFKRRKGLPAARTQVRVASVQDTAALDDGLSWRKYGQKDILGAKYPRAYFRCTHRQTQGCAATKQVQRADGDPLLYDVVYHGAHTCAQAALPGAERLRRQLELEHGHAAGDGVEQRSPPAPKTEGVQAGLEPATPFSFPSTPVSSNNAGAGAGCFPLITPASTEWQLRSCFTGGDLGADVDFDLHQFGQFFTDPTEPFQWEFQDLYAAN